jgi:hypothetical protein
MAHPAEILARRHPAPRYMPDRAFPPYQYVPGVNPHPVRDARGHSRGASPPTPACGSFETAAWRELTDWPWGVDLFNAFFFWEAHEAWERLWVVQPRQSAPAFVLQGMIQLAAGLLKLRIRSVSAADRLATAGLQKLTRAATTVPSSFGLNLDRTISDFRSYLRPLAERTAPPLDESVPMLVLSGEGGA